MSNDTEQFPAAVQQPDPVRLAELDALLSGTLIRASDSYETPAEILWAGEACIATLGNFSVTTGKAKSRKTFNVSAIAAAALSGGTVLGYRARLPEGKRVILYVDTEQSKYHCHKTLKRILTMAGMPTDKDNRNLIFHSLRGVMPNDITDLVERALENHKDSIGLVIIDGIRDMMFDINDPTESVVLVNNLMRWTSVYNVHIHAALHLNKSDDNVRGHIGTEINNKAETVLLVGKDRFDNGLSQVSPLYTRGMEFKPFHFQIGDSGIPQEVCGSQPEQKERRISYSDLTEEQHTLALDAAFKHCVIKGHNKMVEALASGYATVSFERGSTTFGKILDYLVRKEIVIKQNKHEYYLKRDYPTFPMEVVKQSEANEEKQEQ